MILECLKCGRLSEYSRRCERCNEVTYPITYEIDEIPNIMGEGNTPMFSNKNLTKILGCKSLSIKNEGTNPTGSFKDRGSAYEIFYAKENGNWKIVLASTGNMGASMAAYCAFFGIECTIYVPEKTSKKKIKQMKMYGAKIIKLSGDYNRCMLSAENHFKYNLGVYLAGDYYQRMIGMLSLGKEIFLQSNGMPDCIFIPIGNGNLLYSIFLSLKKYDRFKMPTIIGVQIEHYDMLKQINNNEIISTDGNHKTPATAINITNPIQSLGVLKVIKETEGYMLSVSDKEMLDAQKTLSKNGLYLEPSGAVSFAGAIKMKDFTKGKNVVCIGTGNGLKG